MKVLHVIANLAPRYGGPSKACREMAAAVATLGHQVDIYTTNQDGDGKLPVSLDRPVEENGISIYYYPIQRPRFWGTSLPLARKLGRNIGQYDIVHIHSLYLFHDLVAGRLCQKNCIPYLIRPHGSLDPYLYRRHRLRKRLIELCFQNRVIKGAAAVHYTTEEEMHLAQNYISGVRGVVVPNGLKVDEYQDLPPKGSFRNKYPHIGGGRLLLFMGRVNFKKGLDLLVPAFAKVALEQPDIHLVIAGPDNEGYGRNVRRWLKEQGVVRSATFTGMLQGQDKLAALRDADIFILPSYTENFGISVLEAMACEVPVILSDKVNLWREVKTAEAGVICSTDVQDVAAAIKTLLDDSKLRMRMGRAGKELVVNNYQWSIVARKMESVYRSIVNHDSEGACG